ncbi:condensation domain-containing protein, partial [Achromobacter xylosoxidans]
MPARAHWNQAVLLTPAEPLDLAALRAALARLVEHHDALRLRFTETAAGWSQHYAAMEADHEWLLTADAADEAAVTAHCDAAQRSLDLARGPLLRALVLRLADGGERLLIAIHHLAVDGVSWRILLEDLQAAYQAARAGRRAVLP